MCGNEKGSVAHLQNDLEKISRIESENGPPIGCDVPNTLKTFVELLNRIEVGKEYEVVDFSGFSASLVDAADFSRKDKPCGSLAVGWDPALHGYLQVRFQPVKTVFRFHELFSQF